MQRPSEIKSLLKILEAGIEKKHGLCSCFKSYTIGIVMWDTAAGLVTRHSQDIVGDNAFHMAQERMSIACKDSLLENASFEFCKVLLGRVPDACTKLLQAVESWSRAHVEEQMETLQDLIQLMVQSVMHCTAFVMDYVAVRFFESAPSLNAVVAAWSLTSYDMKERTATSQRFSHVMRALDSAQQDTLSLTEEIKDLVVMVSSNFEKVREVAKVDLSILVDFVEGNIAQLGSCSEQLASVSSICNGFRGAFASSGSVVCWLFPPRWHVALGFSLGGHK
jgi:hypothetical protein